jgi:Vacuolar-sorting protein 54, of GARP complex
VCSLRRGLIDKKDFVGALFLCVQCMRWSSQNNRLHLCQGLQHTCRALYDEILKRLDSVLQSTCMSFNIEDFSKVTLCIHWSKFGLASGTISMLNLPFLFLCLNCCSFHRKTIGTTIAGTAIAGASTIDTTIAAARTPLPLTRYDREGLSS